MRLSKIANTSGFLVLAASLGACGSSDDGASGSGGGNLGNGGVGPIFGGTGSTGNNGQGASNGLPFEECAGEISGVEGLPLDIYMMQDHTASMGVDCPLDTTGGPSDTTKWCYATHALAQYFMSDAARGHRAALQFMTVEDYVCEGGDANGEARAAVGLTPLPVDANHALVTALDQDSPDGGLGTRIEAALHGIATFTAANRTPAREMIGILVTDGDPNGCEENVNDLADIIRDHLASTGIRTFIIGMTGATLDNLEVLAAAGGAPEHGPDFCGDGRSTCHYWSVGDGDPVAFVNALQQIQAAAAIPCEYIIPAPPPGENLDPNLVNITYTATDGAQNVVARVTDAGACGGDGGWYYDNPAAPSAIELCEATCNAVTGASSGDTLHVAYGCATVEDIR